MINGILGNGGAEGARTPDLYTASVALSQLSYGPTCLGKISADYSVRAGSLQVNFAASET